MNKLEPALRKCRKIYQTYEKQIKIAVIAIVVITALLLFGGNGKNDEIVVDKTGEMETELMVEEADSEIEDEELQSKSTKLVVDISGCVKNPGVYEFEDGTRLYDVIQQAGGLTKEADLDAINQAELVTDGQKILIPEKVETMDGAESTTFTPNASSNGKININQADSMTLQEIPGIGPATADKIIQYREANGRFQSIEDLKNVSGIGDKTFEKMKDKICV